MSATAQRRRARAATQAVERQRAMNAHRCALGLPDPCLDAPSDEELTHARRVRREADSLRSGPPTPLARMTLGRLAARERGARVAILPFVLGLQRGEVVPARFRTNSNHPLFPRWLPELDIGDVQFPPCPSCGEDDDEAVLQYRDDNVVRLTCFACGENLIFGDYDFNETANCRRYLADREAGLVYDPEQDPRYLAWRAARG